MALRTATHRKYSIHGLAVEAVCGVPPLDDAMSQWLWPFETDALPDGASRASGVIRLFDGHEVLRHLSPSAVPVAASGQLLELYQEGERFWLVDDRWGMCEINVLKGTWKSWILPQPTLDALRVAEMAVLWPIAQLLRPKGLYLLPAVSAARADFGLLLLSPFNLEGELRALIRAGYDVVGQRWTAIREEAGRIELLQMPGLIERESTPRLRVTAAPPESRWIDLAAEYCGIVRHSAYCNAVLVVEPGRRPLARAAQIQGQRATDHLRRAWPISELHPFRRHGQLPAKLAQGCAVFQAELSRRPEDLLVLLDSVRSPVRGAGVLALPAGAGLAAAPPLRIAG